MFAESTAKNKDWILPTEKWTVKFFDDIPATTYCDILSTSLLWPSESKSTGQDVNKLPSDLITDKLFRFLTKANKYAAFQSVTVRSGIVVEIPISLAERLKPVILESAYILDLIDNWDGEGSLAYSVESWMAAIDFTIKFYQWISGIYSGEFYFPKIYHGPNGSIDIVWSEKDFRLFVNIDLKNDNGSYYSDLAKAQSSEGSIPSLRNVDFRFITPPIRL